MMRVIVAEEGRELEPDREFQEIYQRVYTRCCLELANIYMSRQGNLTLALQSLTGITAQVIYLSSGEQLREDNAEELLTDSDLVSFSHFLLLR